MAKPIATSVKSTLARKLKRLRRQRGLTQTDLGAAASVGRTLVAEIEAGSANPTVDSLEKIAAALKVEFVDLFSPVA
jgi:transcriptional regulator with XRE-family HTH domain